MAYPFHCQGLLGRLAGHKYHTKPGDGYVHRYDNCVRCGMPRTGWPQPIPRTRRRSRQIL